MVISLAWVAADIVGIFFTVLSQLAISAILVGGPLAVVPVVCVLSLLPLAALLAPLFGGVLSVVVPATLEAVLLGGLVTAELVAVEVEPPEPQPARTPAANKPRTVDVHSRRIMALP